MPDLHLRITGALVFGDLQPQNHLCAGGFRRLRILRKLIDETPNVEEGLVEFLEVCVPLHQLGGVLEELGGFHEVPRRIKQGVPDPQHLYEGGQAVHNNGDSTCNTLDDGIHGGCIDQLQEHHRLGHHTIVVLVGKRVDDMD